MNILDKIVLSKRGEIELRKEQCSLKDMKRLSAEVERNIIDFKAFICDPNYSGIISEYKRKSPSKGVINDRFEVEELVKAYRDAGASAVSVLTDKPFFGGSEDYLKRARNVIDLPILRKEFIIDEYQIYEAKYIGADAILLICECLDKRTISYLKSVANDIGLQVLIELHSKDQIEKLPQSTEMIGINNRNLKNFYVDFQRSIEMLELLPKEAIKIAESGLRSISEVKYLHQAGFDGFLIGETFMKQEDPLLFAKGFIQEFMDYKQQVAV